MIVEWIRFLIPKAFSYFVNSRDLWRCWSSLGLVPIMRKGERERERTRTWMRAGCLHTEHMPASWVCQTLLLQDPWLWEDIQAVSTLRPANWTACRAQAGDMLVNRLAGSMINWRSVFHLKQILNSCLLWECRSTVIRWWIFFQRSQEIRIFKVKILWFYF